jgi:hypothetical protein
MLPGPEVLIACPYCDTASTYGTLSSGNTFGARGWTDGRQIAPMWKVPPSVVKCRGCGRCHWLKDAREIGQAMIEDLIIDDHIPLPRQDIDPAELALWRKAGPVQEPSEEEYYQAFAEGLAGDDGQERTLRMLAWWRRNDGFRNAGDGAPAQPMTPAAEGNLRRFLELLDEKEGTEGLMMAEILRQLGEFDAASQMLDRCDAERYGVAVRRIRALCESRDRGVRLLEPA